MDTMPPIQQIPETGGFRRKKIIIGIAVLSIIGLASVILAFLFWGRKNGKLPSIGKQTQESGPPREDPIPDDIDRDGLTNEEEKAAGTSETEFDTDFDGLADIDEIRVWKTDPKNPDTDGDGFGDGAEVIRGYNPAGAGKLQR